MAPRSQPSLHKIVYIPVNTRPQLIDTIRVEHQVEPTKLPHVFEFGVISSSTCKGVSLVLIKCFAAKKDNSKLHSPSISICKT